MSVFRALKLLVRSAEEDWCEYNVVLSDEVFPTYIAPALQAVSPWCLTLPKSPIVTQLFGGSRINEGLGLFALTFDWTTLSSYGPLYTPLVAQVCFSSCVHLTRWWHNAFFKINQWVAVVFSIFIFMAAYRYNWFGWFLSSFCGHEEC